MDLKKRSRIILHPWKNGASVCVCCRGHECGFSPGCGCSLWVIWCERWCGRLTSTFDNGIQINVIIIPDVSTCCILLLPDQTHSFECIKRVSSTFTHCREMPKAKTNPPKSFVLTHLCFSWIDVISVFRLGVEYVIVTQSASTVGVCLTVFFF